MESEKAGHVMHMNIIASCDGRGGHPYDLHFDIVDSTLWLTAGTFRTLGPRPF